MKKRSVILILVLAAPFLAGQQVQGPAPTPGPSVCSRTVNVPAKSLANELTKVTNLCYATYCRGGWACASTYSHPQPLWSGFNEKTFSIAEQDAFIKAAQQAASGHAGMCGKDHQRVTGYQFKIVPVGMGPHSDLALFVTISFGACKAGT